MMKRKLSDRITVMGSCFPGMRLRAMVSQKNRPVPWVYSAEQRIATEILQGASSIFDHLTSGRDSPNFWK